MTAGHRHHRALETGRAWLCVVLLSLTAAGCAELPASARQTLTDARQDYASHDYRSARVKLDGIIAAYPSRPETANAFYLRALCRVGQSNKAAAGEDIQRCISVSSDRKLTAKAHAMAAALLFEAGNTDAATSHYEQALKALPDEPNNDLVHYRYGLCLQRRGSWKNAKVQFATVFQRYPDGPLADHAKRLFDWPHPYFSIQCDSFRDRRKANARAHALNQVGLRARVEARPLAGETLYAVLVGQYRTYDEAQSGLLRVTRHADGAFVIP